MAGKVPLETVNAVARALQEHHRLRRRGLRDLVEASSLEIDEALKELMRLHAVRETLGGFLWIPATREEPYMEQGLTMSILECAAQALRQSRKGLTMAEVREVLPPECDNVVAVVEQLQRQGLIDEDMERFLWRDSS